jgi:hypothetical protein
MVEETAANKFSNGIGNCINCTAMNNVYDILTCSVSSVTKIHKKDEEICHTVLLAQGETFDSFPLLKYPSMLWVNFKAN